MNTLAERLSYAMQKSGMSQASLAEAVGVSQPSIWKLATGKTQSSRKLVEIANALGVRPRWLAVGHGSPYSESSDATSNQKRDELGEPISMSTWDRNTPLDSDEVEVPFLKDIEFACGTGRIPDEDFNGFMLRFAKSTLRRVGANSDGSSVLCFPARGNSMEPFIPDGTTVAVNTNDKKVVDGKVYAINQGGWKRIKLLFRTSPESLTIRSFNSDEYPDEKVLISDIEIIGRVFWYSVLI